MYEKIYERVLKYKSAMAQARRLLAKGVVSETEFNTVEAAFAEKYRVSFRSVFRENDLIISGINGNMSHHKEVVICPETLRKSHVYPSLNEKSA